MSVSPVSKVPESVGTEIHHTNMSHYCYGAFSDSSQTVTEKLVLKKVETLHAAARHSTTQA